MKFKVIRTSFYGSDECPISGATLINPNRKNWEEAKYIIEINSLEELIDLIKTNGKIILGINYVNPNELNWIEIYDDYRE